MRFALLQRLFRHEAASGIALMLAAALALILANSPFAASYDLLLSTHGSVRIGDFGIDKPLLLWINDGLMAIFFLLVGLEIKREVIGGELSDRKRALLPAAAAIGGMIIPALTYLGFTWNTPGAASGWAIPSATDIAFSLGVMALLGSRVPASLKLFLTALAIIDDLGAIVIIAVFYTEELSWVSIDVALAALAVLLFLNLAGVQRVIWYLLVGLVLWVFVLKSGSWRRGSGSASCRCSGSPMPACPSLSCHPLHYSGRCRSASPQAYFSASRSASLVRRLW